MKAIVYGAGAIGGTTGAARAGHDVLLVERIRNTNDLRQRSLRPWVPSP